MPISDRDSVDYLLQKDILKGVLPLVGTEQWQSLYVSGDDESGRFGLWCALLDDAAAERALKSDSWDLRIGDGRPGFSQSWQDGETVTGYDVFGSQDGIRPLVHYRSFYGAFPKYCEIDQEFRLYHDLAYDSDRSLLLGFDNSGREVEVVRIASNEITARLKYLRQFQAGTRQNLAIYVDSVRYSTISLDEVGERHEAGTEERARWSLNVVSCDFRREYSTFCEYCSRSFSGHRLGRKLVSGPLMKTMINPRSRSLSESTKTVRTSSSPLGQIASRTTSEQTQVPPTT